MDELEQFGLPRDTGRDEVEIYCGACHSLRLVAQQRQTKEGWNELLIWMVEEQEMEEPVIDDRKLIIEYLAKHLGP